MRNKKVAKENDGERKENDFTATSFIIYVGGDKNMKAHYYCEV